MAIPPIRLRPALEPVVAAVFLSLWLVAELGRLGGPAAVLVLVLYSTAIAVSRLVPRLAIGIVVLLPVLQLVGAIPAPQSTSWPIAGASALVAFVVAATAPRLLAWIALVAVVIHSVLLGFVLVYSGDWLAWVDGAQLDLDQTTLVRVALLIGCSAAALCCAAWAIGLVVSVSSARRTERRLLATAETDLAEADHELRVVRERERIAQDVHDVLAHSLAVVVAVADGSRYLMAAKPETTETALREIADTARGALVDLRGLIEGLRDNVGAEPQPGLADLDALVDRLGLAGVPVRIETSGTPQTLTASQELAVYRIVQESLTNVLKHSGTHATALVSLNWDGPGLALTVSSTGDATGTSVRAAASEQTHHNGIRNMKDRAYIAGGWLTAGLESGGEPVDDAESQTGSTSGERATFLVTAYLPAIAAGERMVGETRESRRPAAVGEGAR